MHKNINNFWFVAGLILVITSCRPAVNKSSVIRQMKNDLDYLAADQLEGRETGSQGEYWASLYIANRFRQMNLIPEGTHGYYQDFEFTRKNSSSDSLATPVRVKGRNVIGFIDNHVLTTIVIGAHYDHLGYGGENSLYRGGRAIHNGADDNASGTTAMLMLAERLRKRDKQNNYLFIAFSGEEEGLIGSNIFVKNPTIDLKKANYMINLDMVGRMKDSALVIYGTGTSPVWRNLIGEIRMKELKIKKENSGIGPSDQTSFYLQDIPVLHFFTGQHEDYHRPSDDADKINFNGMYEVVAMIDSVVSRLNASGKIGFTKTIEQDSQIAPKFSVTLGVVPDYVFDGIGMRIDGISDGRPAQQAGLKKGDIVIKMGPVTVKDMVTYMQGLSKFKKGDTTTVWVKRESKILPFRIKF